MRITQTMLQDNMLRNLFASQKQMDKYFTQIYTGKKIQRPSDDPVIAMRGMSYRTAQREIAQYKRNASGIWKSMDHADDALDKATRAMHRMEELAAQAANASMTPDDRISTKPQVEPLRPPTIETST